MNNQCFYIICSIDTMLDFNNKCYNMIIKHCLSKQDSVSRLFSSLCDEGIFEVHCQLFEAALLNISQSSSLPVVSRWRTSYLTVRSCHPFETQPLKHGMIRYMLQYIQIHFNVISYQIASD